MSLSERNICQYSLDTLAASSSELLVVTDFWDVRVLAFGFLTLLDEGPRPWVLREMQHPLWAGDGAVDYTAWSRIHLASNLLANLEHASFRGHGHIRELYLNSEVMRSRHWSALSSSSGSILNITPCKSGSWISTLRLGRGCFLGGLLPAPP